jgi:hypothetical protein
MAAELELAAWTTDGALSDPRTRHAWSNRLMRGTVHRRAGWIFLVSDRMRDN